MIYGIKVKDYVIREVARQIDRERNQLHSTLLFDVLFGSEWSGNKASARKAFGFTVEAARNEQLWKHLKDATNLVLMEYIYGVLTTYAEDFAAYLSYEKNPEIEERVQGEGQEPVTVQKPNPYRHVLEELSATLFAEDRTLLAHAIALEPMNSGYSLVELGE